MARTLYAWQDKDSMKYYLSAFPPMLQSILDDPAKSALFTEAAKYRPALEFGKLSDLTAEIERRKGDGRRRNDQAVVLKWDEGSGPDGV